jgi:Outer membrane protein beta-barrel domain
MMKRVFVMVGLAMFVLVAPASAQRVEVSGLVGWTFSDGVEGDGAILAGDGNIYDAVDVKDSFSWGFDVGVNATDSVQVGFLFGQQLSTMLLKGTAERELGDLTINTYHPYVAFNFGAPDASVRPYLMVGFGATNYGRVDFRRANGEDGRTSSQTQFSTTWGAGVKVYGGAPVGFRAGIQWTPTYITSDSEGWWCDPYWGCYVVGDAKYANQFQFNGGVVFRF